MVRRVAAVLREARRSTIIEPRIISDELLPRPDIRAIGANVGIDLTDVAVVRGLPTSYLSRTMEAALNKGANTKIAQHREYCATIPGARTVPLIASNTGAWRPASYAYIEQLVDLIAVENRETLARTKALTFQSLAVTLVHANAVFLTSELTDLHLQHTLHTQTRYVVLAQTQTHAPVPTPDQHRTV